MIDSLIVPQQQQQTFAISGARPCRAFGSPPNPPPQPATVGPPQPSSPLNDLNLLASYTQALDKVASTPLESVTPENTLLLLAEMDAEVRRAPSAEVVHLPRP